VIGKGNGLLFPLAILALLVAKLLNSPHFPPFLSIQSKIWHSDSTIAWKAPFFSLDFNFNSMFSSAQDSDLLQNYILCLDQTYFPQLILQTDFLNLFSCFLEGTAYSKKINF
jgi:hypothetical protein